MGNRLKEIWAGFEGVTSRHLTGGGVENIPVPHRVDFNADEEPALPEGVTSAPAEAAFAVLREKLSEQEKRFSIRPKKRRAALPEEAPEAMANQSFGGEELIKGMKATAFRTERSDYDYSAFMATDAGRATFKKLKQKKKRFGLF